MYNLTKAIAQKVHKCVKKYIWKWKWTQEAFILNFQLILLSVELSSYFFQLVIFLRFAQVARVALIFFYQQCVFVLTLYWKFW